MEITAALLIDFSTLLGKWVSGITKNIEAQKQKYVEVLSSVLDALTITRSYIAHLNRGNPREYDREEILSKLWNSASKELYNIGENDLANKCGLKGYYWAAPDSWKGTEYSNAEIEVNKVFNDVQKLLNENT